MAEQTEQIESSFSWQELTAKEAAHAVFGGYSHFVNNGLAPLSYVGFYDLDSEQLKKHTSLMESLCVELKNLKLEKIPFEFNQESVEQAMRLTAQWLKEKIEKKIRRNLGLPLDEENPAQIWSRQAEKFYFFKELSDEDRQAIKNSLRLAMTAWGNLEALADPKRKIKPDAKLEKYPGGGKIFNFWEQLTLPR